MKIISYKVGSKDDLSFTEMNLSKVNLVVGASATGKTRLLNTIFNGDLAAVGANVGHTGTWDFIFEHRHQIYQWSIETGADKGAPAKVLKETIRIKKNKGAWDVLLKRDLKSFIYDGNKLPQMNPSQSGIYSI